MRPGVLHAGMLALEFGLIWLACQLGAALARDLAGATAYGMYPLRSSLIFALVFLAARVAFGGYRRRPAAFETDDMLSIFQTSAVGCVAALVLDALLPQYFRTSAGTLVIAALLVLCFLAGLRMLLGYFIRSIRRPPANAQKTIVVGAANAAQSLITAIEQNPRLLFHVVGCVDDHLRASFGRGARVLGRIDQLPGLLRRHDVDCVIIAIPSAEPALVKRVVELCSTVTRPDGKSPLVKVVPGVSDLLKGNVQVSRIRDVRLEDLLPREPVNVDLSAVAPHLENRVVLVTGAGGSIGSELCRQIASFEPELLLLLGHGENSLFAIEQELRAKAGFTRTQIILADVEDAGRIRTVFSQYRPHIVFHAAAHKHVPILESNVCEAVRNNVLGTNVVALAAAASGAAKFVLLSTDKAVNPTSVMGATKRLAELICQSFENRTGTEFVSVRFGNVLGSRGSVLPVFNRQIAAGGPVTITHRDMRRYFMTIPEAVTLVLQASAIGRDGQVFVLDMGEPVRIIRLAETLITLSGFTPYRDIDIVETGIRPGEKLFEEILTSQEGVSRTSHDRLFIAFQERMEYDALSGWLDDLKFATRRGDHQAVLELIQALVPSYQPGKHLLSTNGKPTYALQPLTLGRQSLAKSNGAAGAAAAAAADGAAADGDGAAQPLDGALAHSLDGVGSAADAEQLPVTAGAAVDQLSA